MGADDGGILPKDMGADFDAAGADDPGDGGGRINIYFKKTRLINELYAMYV